MALFPSGALFAAGAAQAAPPAQPQGAQDPEWLRNRSCAAAAPGDAPDALAVALAAAAAPADAPGAQGPAEAPARDTDLGLSDVDRKRRHRTDKKRRRAERTERSEKERRIDLSRRAALLGASDPRLALPAPAAEPPSGTGEPAQPGPAQRLWYFDGRGDENNVVFGCPYGADVPLLPRVRRPRPCVALGAAVGWRRLASGELELVDLASPSARRQRRYWTSADAFAGPGALKARRPAAPRPLCADYEPLGDAEAIPEEPSPEEQLRERTRELSARTASHPEDADAWLAYAELQDRYAALAPRRAAAALLEKKLAVLQRALERHPRDERLVLAYLGACAEAWEPAKVRVLWERILACQGTAGTRAYPALTPRLCHEYLAFALGDFGAFSVGEARAAYARLMRVVAGAARGPAAAMSAGEAEELLVELFCEAAGVELSAGYAERALGLWQAAVEFNCFRPLAPMEPAALRREFLRFWDSEAPRVGEEGALGWVAWTESPAAARAPARTAEAPEPARQPLAPESGAGGWATAAGVVRVTQDVDDFLAQLQRDVAVAAEPHKRPRGEGDDENDENDSSDDDDDAVPPPPPPPEPPVPPPPPPPPAQTQSEAATAEEREVRRRAGEWAEEEQRLDERLWAPERAASSERGGDAERVVVAGDVEPFLIALESPRRRLDLALRFAEFLGAVPARSAPTRGPRHRWRALLLDDRTLPHLLEPLWAGGRSVAAAAPAGCGWEEEWEAAASGAWGGATPVRLPAAAAEVAAFTRRALAALARAFPGEAAPAEARVSWERRFAGPEAAWAAARDALAAARADLRLWNRHAQNELSARALPAAAARVYRTAMEAAARMGPAQRAHLPQLAYAYARLLAFGPPEAASPRAAARALASVVARVDAAGDAELAPMEALRARRAYEERAAAVRPESASAADAYACACGAFLELLTAGADAAAAAWERARGRFLAGTLEHERLCELELALLWRTAPAPRVLRAAAERALELYPANPLVAALLCGSCAGGFRVRAALDAALARHAGEATLWLCAARCDAACAASVLERAVAGPGDARRCAAVWLQLVEAHLQRGDARRAKQALLRAVRHVPWSKRVWTAALRDARLREAMAPQELRDLAALAAEKEVRLRVPLLLPAGPGADAP
eukprot:m51a1_g11127 hypothetical protein (1147) ;mRNA; f:127163-130603